jgi:phenylpropionate dioxygenase-like ring-hydroxylating dioxygenase large terminal subunit
MRKDIPSPVELVERLIARIQHKRENPRPLFEKVSASAYLDEQRAEAEQRLFRSRPLILGHESQLPNPGDSLVHDWTGLPLITIRDRDGQLGTFMNACRHRGMRLVQDEGCSHLRSLVCPYHQWTYGLDGALRNIPLSESFRAANTSELGLTALPTEVRHGLIWCQPDGRSMNLDEHLAGLGADLDYFGTGSSVFSAQSVRTVDCNWKLIQDAFLDGYHVVRLHKDTVGPFFQDSLSESDDIGDHIRSAIARKELQEAIDLPPEQIDCRYHTSFSYTVFPNSVLIMHPDYTSILNLYPRGPHQTVLVHTMLTPHTAGSDKERDHYQRSFKLIDEGVFEAEDLFVSIGAHGSMRSGATKEVIFGGYEEAAVRFHRRLDQYL